MFGYKKGMKRRGRENRERERKGEKKGGEFYFEYFLFGLAWNIREKELNIFYIQIILHFVSPMVMMMVR